MAQTRQNMGSGNVKKLLLQLMIPAVVAQVVNLLYNIVDRIYIGHIAGIGAAALTGVGLFAPILMLLNAFAMLIGAGGAPRTAIALGQGNKEEAEKIIGNSFTMLLFFAVVLTIGFYAGAPILLRLFGASEATLPYALAYSRIYILGSVCVLLVLGMNPFITTQGFAKISMLTTVIGAGINIILDPILIFVLDMGVAGAALATIISQFVSFCLLLVGCGRGGNIRIDFAHLRMKPYYYLWIFKGGLPSLARQGLASVATICLNQAARPFGDAAIAAMGVVQRIAMFGGSAMIGFGQGFQPVCGFNYGAGLYRRVKDGFWFCVRVTTIFMLAVSVLGFVFAPQLVAVFRDDPEVVDIGTRALRFQCVTFCLQGWVVMSNMCQQTMGLTTPATFLAVARQGLFFVPLVWLFSALWGLTGIEMTQTAADLLTFLCAVPLQARVLRRLTWLEHKTAK